MKTTSSSFLSQPQMLVLVTSHLMTFHLNDSDGGLMLMCLWSVSKSIFNQLFFGDDSAHGYTVNFMSLLTLYLGHFQF